MDSMASWSHTAGTVRDGDGKVVRAGTENAARWNVGQPVRLESEVDLRVDGEGLEVSKRKQVSTWRRGPPGEPIQACRDPLTVEGVVLLAILLHEATFTPGCWRTYLPAGAWGVLWGTH